MSSCFGSNEGLGQQQQVEVGHAVIGSATSAASWRIKRLDESGDPELIIKWADGDSSFDNIWDNGNRKALAKTTPKLLF